jgi:hypothetical protein
VGCFELCIRETRFGSAEVTLKVTDFAGGLREVAREVVCFVNGPGEANREVTCFAHLESRTNA